MAIPTATVWRVRIGGNENNGGGFVPGGQGVDRSQQDAAHTSGVNLTVDASINTDVLPDGHAPDTADVNNMIQVTNRPGFTPGAYHIVSIQSGKWRLDRSPAAAGTNGGAWALGGSFASPGKAGGLHVGGNTISLAAGTYTLNMNSSNIPNGRVHLAAPPAGAFTRIVGEDAVNRPVFARGSNTVQASIATLGGAVIRDIVLDGGNYIWTAGTALSFSAARNLVENTLFRTWGAAGAVATQNFSCEFAGCSFLDINGALALGPGMVRHCYFKNFSSGNSGGAFTPSAGSHTSFNECIFDTSSWHYVRLYANSILDFHRCIFYGIGGNSFFLQTYNGLIVRLDACIFENISGYVFNGTGAGSAMDVKATNCAFHNCTSGFATPEVVQVNTIAGTESFFVDAAGGDFNLNDRPGGGAMLRSMTKVLAA